MFKNKRKYLILVFIILLSISSVGCGIFDQEPKPPIDEEDTIEGPLENPIEEKENE